MNNFNSDNNQRKLLEKYSDMSTSMMFKMVEGLNKLLSFSIRNKKIIYTIIALFILIRITSYFVMKEPKGIYEITTNTGLIYNTNKIEVKDGCVHFNRTSNDEEIIICGGVTIVKSK
jgi:hypothetical protein